MLQTDAKLCISWGSSVKKEGKIDCISARAGGGGGGESEGWVSCAPVLNQSLGNSTLGLS